MGFAWLTLKAPRVLPQPESFAHPRPTASLRSTPELRVSNLLNQALRGNQPIIALKAAERELGHNHPEIDRVRALIDQACRAPTLLRLEGRSGFDARRDPARKVLEQRCAGIPQPSLYVPTADIDSPLRQDEGARSDHTQALADLRSAADRRSLIEAFTRVYRNGSLPQEQIFADRRRLLPGEAEAVILAVANWRDCARLAACGPDSLLTLEVCALHGCPAGADLRQAWHEALSPRDYESVEAVHAWLARIAPPAGRASP